MLTAFGKVILLGEHAVVYGRPALAVGLPGALVLESCISRPGPFRVRVFCAGIEESDGSDTSDTVLGEVLRLLKKRLGDGDGGCEILVRSTIRFGAGLGSSAALSVLLVRAIAAAKGIACADEEVRSRAHELEKHFHGNPSGIDDTVATYGGLCLFRRGGWDGVPGGLPGAQAVTPEALVLPGRPIPLVIGDTGVPRATRDVVAGVRRRWEDDRKGTEAIFDRIGKCVLRGARAISEGDVAGLAGAMRENQTVLAGLGVSIPEIDAMVRLALDAGAEAAKLTGAGGGGCVIALAPGKKDRVLDAWRAAGFHAWIP
ncbi:MAG: mevalonate kinase [Deltaproteobacteria bacterium]|nr:mevalonate kinase [Deltaproteobacteria bacterium]